MFRKSEKGFTLIELMIVVAIIGILAAIAIPNFLNLKDKATWGTAKANLDVMRSALAAYAANDASNRYPTACDYTSFTGTGPLKDANLPAASADAKLTAVSYASGSGAWFTIIGTSADKYGDILTANPTGITPAVYSH